MKSDQPRIDRATQSSSAAKANVASASGNASQKEVAIRSHAQRKRKVDSDWFVFWVAEFEKLLRDKEWASAKLVFKWMKDVGCDAESIIYLLAACTHPDADNGNPLAVQIKTNSRNLLRRLKRFQMLASKTHQGFQALEAEPYAAHVVPLDTSVFRVELPVALRTVGDYLKHPQLGIPLLQRAFDGRKIPSGLTLVTLCAYIRRITGRNAYPQIALLLNAGHAAHKQNREVDPESLSKKIKRFQKNRPELFNALAEQAEPAGH